MDAITIKANWDIDHDGRRIAPGETATLAEDAARALIEAGAAVLAEAPADVPDETPVDRHAVIAEATAGLEEGNPDHWTKSGKPEIRALEVVTDFNDISAAERDVAWAEYTTANGG